MDATISIGADVRQALRGIERVNDRLERMQRVARTSATSLKGMERAAGAVNSALRAAGAALVAFGTQRAISGIVDATLQMEQFRTQLTTYLGDQRLANAEIERLSDLASTLPQNLSELTAAFVIFQRTGVDTSTESLRAFANIASSNGKSVTQFAEAVADAVTGEFERLKEFGIKVTRENGQLVAKIGDQQVAVAKTSSQLVDQLRALGEEGGRFGNVTVGSLTQALSNLQDTVFKTSVALGGQGLTQAIADVANRITDLITKNKPLVREIGVNLTKAFLAVTAVGEFLIKNLGLIGKAMIILLKIKLAMFALSAAKGMFALGKAILGIVPAVVGFGKQVLNVGKFLIALTPAGRVGRIVLAGITALGAAWAWLRGETEETAEATEESTGIIGDAFANAFDALGIEGLDELQKDLASIAVDAEKYALEADKAAAAMDEAEAAAARNALTQDALAATKQAEADAFTALLDKYGEEAELMRIRVEQGDVGVKIKEIETELGRELTEIERERVGLAVRQNNIAREQIKYQATINRYRDQLADTTQSQYKAEMAAIQEAKDLALQVLEERREAGVISAEFEATERRDIHQAMLAEQYRLSMEFNKRARENALDVHRSTVHEQMQMDFKRYRNLQQLGKGNLAQQVGLDEKEIEMVNERMEFEKKSTLEKTQFAIQQGATVFEALGAQNKKAFEAAKAFNIANAIMNTYAGATKALATYPPPFNFIAAAAVVASGLAQVAAIRSQQYSGRALGGPVMGNTSYIVGENGPELFTPTTNGNITRNGDLNRGEPVNINFNIQANDATGFDDLLIQRRGLITQMVSDAMTERGQRSML